MRKFNIFLAGILFISINQSAIAADTSTVQVITKPPIKYLDQAYGDSFETTWTTNFKKTGNCKNAQLQFTSKRFLGTPEKRALMYGYYFYSADFKTILAKEGMYSTKLEKKSGRISFDFFMLDESGKGGKQPADVLTQCLALDKNFKSPLNLYYGGAGNAPYESALIATIVFKEKK
jgi:hypothetical protein